MALFGPALRFWDKDGIYIIPSLGVALLFFLPPLLLTTINIRSQERIKSFYNPEGFILGLVFLFFSDWLIQLYSLMVGPGIRGVIASVFVVLILIKKQTIFRFLP